MVGADEMGERLLGEMAEVGLDLRYVGRAEDRRTLYALCLIYPDGSGGNVTENDSACAAVDAGWIAQPRPSLRASPARGSRWRYPRCRWTPARSCWRWARRTASCGSPPSPLPKSSSWPAEFDDIDFLALNLDEAAALAGVSVEGSEPEAVVRAALAKLSPDIGLP